MNIVVSYLYGRWPWLLFLKMGYVEGKVGELVKLPARLFVFECHNNSEAAQLQPHYLSSDYSIRSLALA